MLSAVAHFFVAALTASPILVNASPIHTRQSYAVKESHDVPRKWSKVSEAPPNAVINLEIALKQSQFAELERHLYEGI